ncbi:MAG: hypothetical protein FWC41_06235 [Firmicutes bacterium]|nr:hypothetical protein [Bacillota bacterium]
MKKLLLLVGLALTCIIVNAQVGGAVFTPYTPPQNTYQTPPQRTYQTPPQRTYQTYPQQNYQNQNSNNQYEETIRTTAYRMDSNGQYIKMPIKVQQQSSYYFVVERYSTAGLGQWEKIATPAQVQKCSRNYYNDNDIENSFMYKALIWNNWYYFDL